MTKRDSNGRLNMDVVREDERNEPSALLLDEEKVLQQGPSSQYTTEWVKSVEAPSTARSLLQGVGSVTIDVNPRISKSAPALSIKSRQSASGMVRSKLQLQLEQLKRRQALEKETRDLEIEMRKQELEIERERQLADLTARKALQEMEAQLAEAELVEQLEINCDDQSLDPADGNLIQNLAELCDEERRAAELHDAERCDQVCDNVELCDARCRQEQPKGNVVPKEVHSQTFCEPP